MISVDSTGRGAIVLAALLSTLAPNAWAAGGSGGAPGQLLRYGSAARSLSMGDAFAGLADDVTTAYWNPAGLEQLRTAELAGMHAELLDGANYEYVVVGVPTGGLGTFALGSAFMRQGGFERTSLYEDLGETFANSESAFMLSYARAFSGVSFGVSLKAVNQSIAGLSGSGLGADVGLFYRPNHRVSVGASVQNVLEPRVRLDQVDDVWARALRGGAALHLMQGRVVAIGDLAAVDGGELRLSGGMEVWPSRAFALRGGYNGDVENLTAGLGVRRGALQFDYAYNGSTFGLMNVFSVTWRFGVPFGVAVERSRATFSPRGQDRSVSLSVATAVRGEPERWELHIRNPRGEVVQTFDGEGAPPEWLIWKGDDLNGRTVADGEYRAEVVLVDALGVEWSSLADVEVLNFSDETVVPMRIEVSGGE